MRKSFIRILFPAFLFFCLSSAALANSGPVYWQGYPSSEVMAVDKASPIEVLGENLLFDFSEGKSDYTIKGQVKAAYRMKNPTLDHQSVQMAFPFVGQLYNLSLDELVITVDGENVPYKLYFGDAVNSYGSRKENVVDFDFAETIKAISEKPYRAASFQDTDKGKLYTIDVKPTTEKGINLVVEFDNDKDKKVLATGFNAYWGDNDRRGIASWCYGPQSLEIFVLEGDLDFTINAYSDGGQKEKTELLTYEIITREVTLKSYLTNYIEKGAIPNLSMKVSDTQLYNLYAQTLDQHFMQNGFCADGDLSDHKYLQRILVLLYKVEFPPGSEKEVSVNYKTSGTMDMTETVSPLYHFNYILNPASNWARFGDLNIKIIPPTEAPYIVKSSIEFARDENRGYVAALQGLPEEDLSFSLYAKEKVTATDKMQGKLRGPLTLLSFLAVYFALPLSLVILTIVALVVVIKKIRKKTS